MPRDDDPGNDPTLVPDPAPDPRADPTTNPTFAEVRTRRPSVAGTIEGYTVGHTIGTGGMGEVVLALDQTIGREVALKRMHGDMPSSAAISRFLREARVQARLEHPAIVPVYELGRDPTGNPYFTMKRLAGVTLAEHLRAAPAPSLQQLLRTFIDVCLAVEFAHARGVIHRDLKPANIMLGDFGEVYVLDWGVARVADEKEVVGAIGDITTLDGKTEAGALLGTPGYMPPEQIEGATNVGPHADVYALGAILFEILAGESVHPPDQGVLTSTLAGTHGPPSKRAPDRAIPPELDELCLEALRLVPTERPTARELAERVQRFLDGDRDLARRKSLATTALAAAETALATGDTGRPEAIRAAGRALALDPESRPAAELISRLMLEPPKQHPAGLAAQLASADAAVQQRQGRVAVMSLGAVMLFLIASAINGLADPWLLAGIAGWTAIVAGLAYSASRRHASRTEMWLIAIGNAVLGALLTRLFGPLIIAPMVICIMAVSLSSYPQLIAHARIVIGMLIASWALPVALEHAGVLAPTWMVREGAVVSQSSVIRIEGTATTTLLIFANVLAITVIGLFGNALARSRREAQQRIEVQAWHLRQLLPDE